MSDFDKEQRAELLALGAVEGAPPSTLEVAEQIVKALHDAQAEGRKPVVLIAVRLVMAAKAITDVLGAAGIKTALITGGGGNFIDSINKLRDGELQALVLTPQMLTGWRAQLDDVLLVSTYSMRLDPATQFLHRVRRVGDTGRITVMVWIRPEPVEPPEVFAEPPAYQMARIKFKPEVLRDQQDRLLWTLMELGFIEEVELGNIDADNVFTPIERIARDEADAVHRALYGDVE